MVSSTQILEIVLAALAVVAAVLAGATYLSVRAKHTRTLEAIEALRSLLEQHGTQPLLPHAEGSAPPLSTRRSYPLQLPGAAPLPEAERFTREDFAMKVRGIAQDIGVLSDAYCAGPANDAPDPAKLGPVLGRWEDRLVSMADELDGSGSDDDEGEGE